MNSQLSCRVVAIELSIWIWISIWISVCKLNWRVENWNLIFASKYSTGVSVLGCDPSDLSSNLSTCNLSFRAAPFTLQSAIRNFQLSHSMQDWLSNCFFNFNAASPYWLLPISTRILNCNSCENLSDSTWSREFESDHFTCHSWYRESWSDSIRTIANFCCIEFVELVDFHSSSLSSVGRAFV